MVIPMDAGYGQVSPMACASGGGVDTKPMCNPGSNPGIGAWCYSGTGTSASPVCHQGDAPQST